MQRYGAMPMPTPMPTHGTNNQVYGAKGYAPLPPISTVENTMDREMNSLIEHLKVSIKDASAADLETLLGNEDNMIALIEDSQQVRWSSRANLLQGNFLVFSFGYDMIWTV